MTLRRRFLITILGMLFVSQTTSEVSAQIFKKKEDTKASGADASVPPKKDAPKAPQKAVPKAAPVVKKKYTPAARARRSAPTAASGNKKVNTDENADSGTVEEMAALRMENDTLQSKIASLETRLATLENEGKLSPAQREKQETLKARLVSLREKKESLDRAVEGGLDPSIVETSMKEIDAEIARTQSELESIQPVSAEKNVNAINQLGNRVDELDGKVSKMDERLQAQDEKIASYAPSKGFLLKGPGDSYLKISGLLQTRMEVIQDGAPSGDSVSYGTYIRRMRLLFYGQLTKWLNFFVETDNSNLGLNGNWSSRMFIQDAYVEFNVHQAFQVDVGMLLPPFSRHGFQSATSLLGMDYHGALVKYPTGSSLVWRDMGVKARGLLFNDIVEYRLALFSGVHGGAMDPRNPDDAPRLSGRLTFNVFDAEGGPGVGGMFYDGLYLADSDAGLVSTKKVLSFGASFDWQPNLNVEIEDPSLRAAETDPFVVEKTSDYIAAAGDVFWDIPLDDAKLVSLNGQVNFYYYNHGDRDEGNVFSYYNAIGDSLCYTGWGLLGELGVRYSYFQPIVLLDVYESTASSADVGDYVGVAGGFNYYMRGHGTTFKLQVGADQKAGGDWLTAAKLQVQLVF